MASELSKFIGERFLAGRALLRPAAPVLATACVTRELFDPPARHGAASAAAAAATAAKRTRLRLPVPPTHVPPPTRSPSLPCLRTEDELRKQGIQDDEEQRLLSNLRIAVSVSAAASLRFRTRSLCPVAWSRRAHCTLTKPPPFVRHPLLQPLSVQSPGGGAAAPATRGWSTGKKVGAAVALPAQLLSACIEGALWRKL